MRIEGLADEARGVLRGGKTHGATLPLCPDAAPVQANDDMTEQIGAGFDAISPGNIACGAYGMQENCRKTWWRQGRGLGQGLGQR